ncbi:MAG: VWA domain-containing protein [Pseudomonadota bacterium]
MMEFNIDLFHFIRPQWLYALPVVLLAWIFIRKVAASSQWEEFIPKEMIAALQINSSRQSNGWQWALLAMWLTLVLAAAGPTWNKQAVPTVENQQALVIALDLSPSMMATDLTPNRLTRAKFKLIDLLRAQEDGQIALIAYAGDAHTVSPLTDDPRNIEALLPALHPSIMPAKGSNTEAAVALAQQLLRDAGATSGTILLISDGIAPAASEQIRGQLDPTHRLSILGVGGTEPAPIPAPQGGFLRNSKDEIVLASLNVSELQSLAGSLGGRYATLSPDDSDVNRLIAPEIEEVDPLDILGEVSFDAWKDQGYLLAILALPFVLIFFRKGLVYVLPLFFIIPIETEAAEASSWSWADLWQTRDQQGAQLMQEERFAEAATTFENQDWAAVANYRAGGYADAIAQLQAREDVRSLYNRGNAMALNGDLEEAIASYEKVLEQQPDHADAAYNKELLEQLMQQGQDQSDQQNQQQDNSEDQDQQQQNQQNQQQEQSGDQQQDRQQNQQEQQDEQQSEQQQSGESEQQQNDQQQSGQEQSEQQAQDQEQEQENQPADQDQSEEDAEQESEQEPTSGEPEQETDEGEEQQVPALGQEQETPPLDDASEQWLRAIQDDPSGLLRRKFKYQSDQRAGQTGRQPTDPNNEERY